MNYIGISTIGSKYVVFWNILDSLKVQLNDPAAAQSEKCGKRFAVIDFDVENDTQYVKDGLTLITLKTHLAPFHYVSCKTQQLLSRAENTSEVERMCKSLNTNSNRQ